MADTTGTTFNIKRFSVHDGPGIRTSIFLKGCPLQCLWCHNPEGINPEISIWYNRNVCIKCGQCVTVCPNQALTSDLSGNKFIKIDYAKCNITGNCVNICPTGALHHEKQTGKPNQNIKDNLAYIVSCKKEILVRVPLIKNITDKKDNRSAIETFVHELDQDIPIEYLNFNPLTENKYRRLCIPFPLNKM